MNADGSKNRFLVRGSSARWSPSGDRIVYTAQGEPKGSQIFVRYMDAEGATSQITHLTESPANVTWSPDGQSIAFAMKVEKKNGVVDQDAGAARRRQVGRDAAHRRAARLPPGRTGLQRRWLPSPVHGAGDRRHAAAAHQRRLGSQRRRVHARRQADPLHLAARAGCRIPVARIGDLLGQRRQRRDHAADAAQGSRQQPEGLARRQARRLHGHRRVAQHVDRQQAVRDEHRRQQSAPGFRRLGSLAAERAVEGRRHRRLLHRAGFGQPEPLRAADGRRPLRRGAAGHQGHLHAHDDERVEDRQGGRRPDLDADAARHRHLRRRQARSGEAAHRGQRRHPQGQEARRGEGDVVHRARRPEDPGLVHHAAGLRRRPRSTRCSCTSTAARTACTASASTTAGRRWPPTAT